MIFDFKVNKRYTQTLIFFLGLIFSIIIIQHTYPKVFERLVEMEKDINQPNQELNTTSSRISIWKHAYDIITHNIVFGVGTGDVKDALKEEYLQNKEFKMAEKQLNAHNQYLQTFVALGLIGTVFLLLNIALVFIYTVKAKVIEGALFSLLVAFNLLFESMLETQAGIVFIAFFLTLFLDISKQHLIAKSTIIAS
jgi:O-antigen ligase